MSADEEETDMIAAKPPMGWNSWNTFGKEIDENLIRQIADTMAEQAYLDAGSDYLVHVFLRRDSYLCRVSIQL